MGKKPDAKAFLAALGSAAQPDEIAKRPAPVPVAEAPKRPAQPGARAKGRRPRAELIHFGGYLDSETFEKIALLRLRLKKDNSELIELAIDDLFRKHAAKRAFGDG